jgi:hypothetical protein
VTITLITAIGIDAIFAKLTRLRKIFSHFRQQRLLHLPHPPSNNCGAPNNNLRRLSIYANFVVNLTHCGYDGHPDALGRDVTISVCSQLAVSRQAR